MKRSLQKTFCFTLCAAGAAIFAAACAAPELTIEQKNVIAQIRNADQTNVALPANVNFCEPESGKTPLIHAVISRKQSVINSLLQAGAMPEVGDAKGMTPFHYAAEQESTAIAQLLLDRGANVNTVDKYGKTPLMDAARLGNREMVSFLLRAGADPDIVDKKEHKAAVFAATAKNHSAELVKMLLPAEAALPDVIGPITAAILAKNHDTAMDLFTRYFPADLSSDQNIVLSGLAVMKAAIYAGDATFVKTLIDRKLTLNTDTHTAYKMLRYVQMKNWFKTFARAKLIDDGKMPLFWAAEKNNAEIVKMLLKAGANPKAEDHHRMMPVDYTRDYEVYRLLKDGIDEKTEK